MDGWAPSLVLIKTRWFVRLATGKWTIGIRFNPLLYKRRTVNPRRIQIVRIDKGGMVDDVMTHST